MKSKFAAIFYLAFLTISCAPNHMSMMSRMGMPGAISKPQASDEEVSVEEFEGINTADFSSLENIIDSVKDKKIVFVGEQHDQNSHHQVQFEFVKGLHERGGKIAVGMEMFQRPFQQFMDQYLNGEIDEKEFLGKTEYFTRWSYNYHYYKPIIDYCKANKLPIIAMNAPKEYTRKVSRLGIDSLSAEERALIPAEMDMTNEAYEKRLREIFSAHAPGPIKGFENFYQSQVLWDETMAESVHNFLVKNPDHQVIVIVGSGHLMYGDGIPDRTFRRGEYDQSIIINHMGQLPTRDYADYIIFTEYVPDPFNFKLGVFLESADDGLLITDTVPGKIGQRCGLEKGDVIIKTDGESTKTLPELKLELFYKKETDTVKLEIIRPRWLLSDKTMEISLKPEEKTKNMMD
ncbi:ChaN family lipoprotein [bacterium]|nr:ChaN family lipoprotein [bacterium]